MKLPSLIALDFDGVLTDNRVLTSENGTEFVFCSRSDGLAFDVLRKLGVRTAIFSTERNGVVSARAAKLRVEVLQGLDGKLETLNEYCARLDISLQSVVFVGNDLNDYFVMKAVGLAVCPSDAHPRIKSIAHVQLKSKGGDGVIRELVEEHFGWDPLSILYGAPR